MNVCMKRFELGDGQASGVDEGGGVAQLVTVDG